MFEIVIFSYDDYDDMYLVFYQTDGLTPLTAQNYVGVTSPFLFIQPLSILPKPLIMKAYF